MIVSVPGEFYVYESEVEPEREELKVFFENLGENDILEVRIKSPEGQEEDKIYHVTKLFLVVEHDFIDLTLNKAENAFEKAARIYPLDMVFPMLDQERNCVSILKKTATYYEHFYRYEGEIDVSFLNRYDCIVLRGLNEYAVELYKKALPFWSGNRVILSGREWRDYVDVLPVYRDMEIMIYDGDEEVRRSQEVQSSLNVLHIIESIPQNEDNSRYEQGIMYYDEVMMLTFMFSYVIHPGTKNTDKKFFLIDAHFYLEGLYGIWGKVFTVARYAIAKGYVPIFEIVSSDTNIYSDHQGDDIWNKFFHQPGGYTLKEVHASSYLALSPNMNAMNIMRYIMNEVSGDIQLSWPKGIFNEQVKEYVNHRRERFLPDPEHTLGVLIRGTDYIHNPLPNHPKHASMEMVIEKIAEAEEEWGFDRIYLSTEDKEICAKMKEYYGERITFTDQERYSVQPGHLLVELHRGKQEEGKGFRLGAEYICSIQLLSQCSCLIASGQCGALNEALRENGGRYRHVYTFSV